MTLAAITYRPTSGTPEDIAQIIADFDQILNVINGLLEADINVQADGPVTVKGNANTAGSSSALARSDHQHIVQGVENVAALPTTGNFLGRKVFLTTDNKHYSCTDTADTGTWEPYSNLDAADVPAHASRHGDGGADEIPVNGIAEDMLKARTIVEGLATGNITPPANTWSAIATLTVTTENAQTVDIYVFVRATNGAGSARNVGVRVRDLTADPDDTIHMRAGEGLAAVGSAHDQYVDGWSFPHNFTTDGEHNLQLEVCADGGTVTFFEDHTFNGDTQPATYFVAVIK